MYWTDKHQELIETYYWCYTASTSAITRNYCVGQLLTVLTTLSRRALHTSGVDVNEDNVQMCLIHQTTKLLPKLKQELLQGTLHYLWIGTKRHIITYILSPRKHQMYDIENKEILDYDTNEADYEMNQDDLRQQILEEIDKKIIEQKILNKTNTILLVLMKQYIIENNYDVTGFDKWVQEKMNINVSTYRSIMSRIRIRSKIFNKKIVE